MKYIINIINCLLLAAIPTVIYLTPVDNNEKTIKQNIEIKQLKSEVITNTNNEKIEKTQEIDENIKEPINKDEINSEKENPTEQTLKEEAITESIIPVDKDNQEVIEEKSPDIKTDVIETQLGKMSGYGPNCVGCSGYTASGKYVGDGNIYYNDKTYGQVRIVAGDYKYKFGTIIRIKNSNISKEPIIAIVLDRGGSIGVNKKYMFDLLYTSEEEAYKYGVSYNVTFEVLRNGY